VDDLVDEGKELIRKRQKLIRIADKSADGWKVVDEYVSDELGGVWLGGRETLKES